MGGHGKSLVPGRLLPVPGVEGRLAVHRKTREQGGWLKSLGGFGKGLAQPLDRVDRQEGLTRGAMGGGRRGRKAWDGADMNPLQPEEG